MIYAPDQGRPSGLTEVLAYLIYKEAFETGNVGRAGHAAHAHGERREGQFGVGAGQDEVRASGMG